MLVSFDEVVWGPQAREGRVVQQQVVVMERIQGLRGQQPSFA